MGSEYQYTIMDRLADLSQRVERLEVAAGRRVPGVQRKESRDDPVTTRTDYREKTKPFWAARETTETSPRRAYGPDVMLCEEEPFFDKTAQCWMATSGFVRLCHSGFARITGLYLTPGQCYRIEAGSITATQRLNVLREIAAVGAPKRGDE